MAWIDFRKVYDIVPHSWIKEILNMFTIAPNTQGLLGNSMKMWSSELCSNDKHLRNVHINRVIFLGDSLSPLLFVLCLVPLSIVLIEVKMGYAMKK